jgi:uncharacterized protein
MPLLIPFSLSYKFIRIGIAFLIILLFDSRVNGQLIDSLPPFGIASKWNSKEVLLRIIPFSRQSWRALNSYTIAKIQLNQYTTYPMHRFPAEKWQVDTSIQNALTTSYSLHFLSNQELQHELNQSSANEATAYSETELEEFRYFFNFLACNQDFEVAIKNGLAFRDVIQDKRLTIKYRMESMALGLLDSIEINPSNPLAFRLPPIPDYSLSDHQIILWWKASPYIKAYYGFELERSFDGKKYSKLTAWPITCYRSDENTTGFHAQYKLSDSLSRGRTVYYRLIGLDYFGTKSLPGPPLIIRVPKKILPPVITSYEKKDNKNLIHWQIAKEDIQEIASFAIWESDSVNRNKPILIQSNIPIASRSVLIAGNVEKTKFYFIEAVRKNAPNEFSFPIMITAPDQTPPAVPVFLPAEMDHRGITRLAWTSSREVDWLGYRLYKSVDSSAEYSLITSSPIRTEYYEDTMDLNTISKKIFFKISAVDSTYNHSKLSAALAVSIYDTIPPSPPSFYFYRPGPNTIELKWSNSRSEDVATNKLFKRAIGSGIEWQELTSYTSQYVRDSIVDRQVESNRSYEYKIESADGAGNKSSSGILIGKPLQPYFLPDIDQFTILWNETKRSVHIQWIYSEPDILEYWIYKSQNNEPLTLYKQLPADTYEIMDQDIQKNNQYSYTILAVHTSGRESKMTSPQRIRIE